MISYSIFHTAIMKIPEHIFKFNLQKFQFFPSNYIFIWFWSNMELQFFVIIKKTGKVFLLWNQRSTNDLNKLDQIRSSV